ncbi:hypothetical protein RKD49_000356 [Streptomyces glaucescens]
MQSHDSLLDREKKGSVPSAGIEGWPVVSSMTPMAEAATAATATVGIASGAQHEW